MTERSEIIYKVYRYPERRIFTMGYRGVGGIDAGSMLCPYRPGMSDEEVAAVNEQIKLSQPTQFQLDLLQSIKDKPTIAWKI